MTPWLEDHPGGKQILLAFAGKDATEHFEAVGHSIVAEKQAAQMHLGRVIERPVKQVDGETAPIQKNIRSRMRREVSLTGGFAPLKRSSAEKGVWEVCNHGFLPSADPVGLDALEGTAFEPFAKLADSIPALGINGAFRRYLDRESELQARLVRCADKDVLESLSDEQLERAFSVLCYSMIAYWRGGTLSFSIGIPVTTDPRTNLNWSLPPVGKLPPFLASPLLAVSERLGRPPMPDYAATVLYNWTRIDPEGPISTSNVRCILRLTGLGDEEWFFKTHVVIEAEAAQAVSAIIGANAATNPTDLLGHLVTMEEGLLRLVQAALPLMYQREADGTPKCSEHVFYQILRPLIGSGSMDFEDEAGKTQSIRLAGPSGAMSSLLPAVDSVLGIKTTSEKLRQALSTFELSMPLEHREFLERLRAGIPIRNRILAMRPSAGESFDTYDTLSRSYNRVIARVLDFRWQHWSYVKHFIMKPGNMSQAVGTGGTQFDFLQQHITDTQEARIMERLDLDRIISPGSPDGMGTPALEPNSRSSRPQSFWSVDGRVGLLARDPIWGWDDVEKWTAHLPEVLHTAVEALLNLAMRMPALVAAEGPFYDETEAMASSLEPLQDKRTLQSLSEVSREHLMTVLCHVSASCIATGGQGRKKAPRCIDRPLQVVARSVGRPPHLDFTELVLCNWGRTENSPDIPAPESSPSDAAEAPSVNGASFHIVWRFIGSPDEEWYRAIHLILHEEARDVIAAIRVGQVGARDTDDHAICGSLTSIASWLNKMCDYLDKHLESKDSRTESLMMRRLAVFVSGSLSDEEICAWVYWSGSSVLMPAIIAFLGIRLRWSTQQSTENGRLVNLMLDIQKDMRLFMPREHLEFLQELERPGASVRRYCLRRFGAKSISVERLHELEVAYNDALNAASRFQDRRLYMATRFYPQLSRAFGNAHSEIEVGIRKGRLQLLKMRQRVDRCLEK